MTGNFYLVLHKLVEIIDDILIDVGFDSLRLFDRRNVLNYYLSCGNQVDVEGVIHFHPEEQTTETDTVMNGVAGRLFADPDLSLEGYA